MNKVLATSRPQNSSEEMTFLAEDIETLRPFADFRFQICALAQSSDVLIGRMLGCHHQVARPTLSHPASDIFTGVLRRERHVDYTLGEVGSIQRIDEAVVVHVVAQQSLVRNEFEHVPESRGHIVLEEGGMSPQRRQLEHAAEFLS